MLNKDEWVVYHCMRTCLMVALDNNINSIVIPAFGGACGELPPQTICDMMYKAYDQIMNPPTEINWEYALRLSNTSDRF